MKINVIKLDPQEKKRKRVCAYCRVSTEHEDQENSLDNQITHYKEVISSNPEYEFVDVYYDYGISGFKEQRPGFQKMMDDARAGKIDLIITKSVTRFARNTVTFLSAERELKGMGIGIFFELQNVNTLSEAGELMITILAAFAQGESDAASELAKLTYRRKFAAGIPVQYLDKSFGYKKDKYGFFVPDENQATWVKKIFEMAADSYSLADIARYINMNGVKTDLGAKFTESTVKRIIENEIYMGDYKMQKNFVNADRKEVKNKGEVDAWYIEDDHVPIVSKKLWEKANMVRAAKRAYLDSTSVIKDITEENYPYMNQIFCAKCGYPLKRRVARNKVYWECNGEKTFHKKFCEGIYIPDSIIRSWGSLHGNIYIRRKKDKLGKTEYTFVKESTWKKTNKKKERPQDVPALSEENYPYMNKIFCMKCGSRLVRYYDGSGSVFWLCNTYKRKGITACTGVRVPDQELKRAKIDAATYIKREEKKNGEKRYSYSSTPEC